MQKNEKIKVKLKLDLQEFIDNNPLTYKEISGKKTLLNTLQKIGLMSARVDKSSMSDSESLEKGERFNALALELINSGMRIDKALLRASREVGFGDFKNIKELKARLNEKNEDHFILTLAESIRSGKKEEVYRALIDSGFAKDEVDAENQFPTVFNKTAKRYIKNLENSGRPDAARKINNTVQLASDLDKMGIKGIDLKAITSLAKDSLAQIEKNDQARFAKENSYRSQVLGDANDLAAEDIKKSITNHISEYTKIGMRENQSAQIIRNLLNEVKQEMKEFLEAVKKSKEFSEDLKKMVEKKIETLDKEISQALNMKEIPQDKYQEIIGLISDLKDLPSIKNVINNKIKLSQTEKNSLLVTKFNNIEKIVIKMDDEIKKNVNQNSGAKAYSQGLNPTITSAAALSGLPKQEIEKISKDIKNISDELEKFIKKIEKFLTENNLLKNATDDNGSIVSDLDKLGELIDNLKSSFTGNLSSKELSALLIKFNEAKGIEDKIEKMFKDDEGVLA
jgi:hypothetical protein